MPKLNAYNRAQKQAASLRKKADSQCSLLRKKAQGKGAELLRKALAGSKKTKRRR